MKSIAAFLLAACVAMAAEPLIINTATAQAKVIAYDLPDPADREAALKFITFVRDRFRPGTDLVDVRTTPEPELGQKLAGGFLFYTTIGSGSKLLERLTGPLGWQTSSGTFQWGLAKSPLATTRAIFAAPNPFGSGMCVVYAGGSNAVVDRINSVHHGPLSFYVYDGTKLIREGSYGPDMRMRDSISKAEAIEDVRQFFATATRVHPQLDAKLAAKLEADAIAAVNAASSGTMSLQQLAYILSYAAARFGDGHTSVRWSAPLTPASAADARFPPLQLRFDNGRFLISSAVDPSLAGSELCAVDGVPVLQFLAPALDRFSGETLGFRAAQLVARQAQVWVFTRLFSPKPRFTLRLSDREAEVATITLSEYQAFAAKQPPPRRPGPTRVDFRDTVAIFTYPSFTANQQEQQTIDSIFAQIAERKATDLIIDLRGNGGGNSGMGEYIFRYIHSGPLRQASEVHIRDLNSGKLSKHATSERTQEKPPTFFSGRKWLLTDNGTFSSATMFAVTFRDYQMGTSIGYETGGVPLTYGDIHSFTLKNSGLSAGVSYKRFFPPKPRPGDDQHGVIPDIPITDDRLAPFRNEPDPVLAFTLAEIAKRSR